MNLNNDYKLIAPCGMNCGICLGYLREKNHCSGCRDDSKVYPQYCVSCIIKNCALLHETESGFCYECGKFPCRRLKQLDKRYRTRYRMSMLENLEFIRVKGVAAFIEKERIRWTCPGCGATICVHRSYCLNCRESFIREN
jgi:hypothetical protein